MEHGWADPACEADVHALCPLDPHGQLPPHQLPPAVAAMPPPELRRPPLMPKQASLARLTYLVCCQRDESRTAAARSASTCSSVESNSSDECAEARCSEARARTRLAWTAQEDTAILQGVRLHGFKWSRIAATLPVVRTDDSVRNRYHRLLRKQRGRQARAHAGGAVGKSASPRRAAAQPGAAAPAGAAVPIDPLAGTLIAPEWLAALEEEATVEAEAGSSASTACTGEMPFEEGEAEEALVSLEEAAEGKHGDMWTAEEDRIIDVGVRVQGLRWRAIAEKLPGRSESGCRNRWVRNQQRLLAQAGHAVQGTRAVCAALAAAGMMRGR